MPSDQHAPIPVTGLQRGRVLVEATLHLTGGLRARPVAGGWHVGPLRTADAIGDLGVVPDQFLDRCLAEMGQAAFGLEERQVDSDVPYRIWRPVPTPAGFQAADQWGFVASNARRSEDAEYARLAASIATSLRAAGIQLRNLSDCYHEQLMGALRRNAVPGRRFANVAMGDLHLACHGLMADLGSARDYIAALAARHVGAPPKIDALNRLAEWAAKPVNAERTDELVRELVAAFGRDGGDPWLWELGEYRNTFLHRLPLGLAEGANRLLVRELQTRYGAVRSISMEIEAPLGSGTFEDALARFVRLGARLEELARRAINFAAHPATPPVFVAT